MHLAITLGRSDPFERSLLLLPVLTLELVQRLLGLRVERETLHRSQDVQEMMSITASKFTRRIQDYDFYKDK